jgi:nitrogen-specific signal transduction histidine kinase
VAAVADTEWDVQEKGIWYVVTARATCPLCGASFQERSERRKAAGPPDTPPLSVRDNGDGTVDLVAAGLFLPLVSHRCAG